MTRQTAVELVREKQYEFQIEYLRFVCEYYEITEEQYFKYQEIWRNLDIWHKAKGKCRLKNELV